MTTAIDTRLLCAVIQAESFRVLVRHLKVNLVLSGLAWLLVVDVAVRIARSIRLSHRRSIVVSLIVLLLLTFCVAERI